MKDEENDMFDPEASNKDKSVDKNSQVVKNEATHDSGGGGAQEAEERPGGGPVGDRQPM